MSNKIYDIKSYEDLELARKNLRFSIKEQEKYNNEVDVLTKKLQDRETDVIELQKKVIDLYEELRRAKVSV